MKKVIIPVVYLFLSLFSSCNKPDELVYKNPKAPIEQRVNDLLSRMTLEEKFWQLYMIPGDLSNEKENYTHGLFGFQVATKGKSANEAEQLLDYYGGGTTTETALHINQIQKYFVEETRLGIPIIPFDEGLHGLVRKGATVFPQAIGLSATWDTALMKEVALSIATEMKLRGIRQNLSPVVNIARDVRWGRTEETYGEDPFLSSQMAVAYVSSFQKKGVIATPKHFVANVGDGGRDSYPIHFNERLLKEIYFPAFKASIQKGQAWSIMTSYNSLNGRPNSANNWLLNQILKTEWGFDGFVISDANAIGGANVLHYTTQNYAESTQQAIENGLDVIFQTSYSHYPLFYEAFKNNMISEKAINNAVKRVLRAKFKLGLFENPYVNIEDIENSNRKAKNKLLAKKAAAESVVLLKNKNQVLPLNKAIPSVAVIGQEATEARSGGYSGPGNNPVSILQGIKNKLAKTTKMNYAQGCGRENIDFVSIPANNLFHYENGKQKSGLKADYFNNIALEGKPDLSRIDDNIDFRWTLFSPDKEKINYDYYSVRWTGKLIAPQTGKFKIGIEGNDGYRLYINNKLVIDNWKKQSFQQIAKSYSFEKDKTYAIKVEFYETVGNASISLIWNVGVQNKWKQNIKEAVLATQKSDVAIVCVGIEEGEFKDRAFLSLPGHQEELILAVAACDKPVIVLLVGGSAITMQNWIQEASAIVDIWYPGEEGGNAVADVLFGDYNPAGRLPITFPIHESQLPLYYNHKPTGRGDDYVNLSGKPLFPFGFGLSYTTFEYSNLQIEKSTIAANEKTKIHFTITNTGNYDGDEVVQLYLKDLIASVTQPIMELKGFKRIHVKKGESKQITFEITPELLSLLNTDMKLVVEPGDFRLMIGASSNDIRLRAVLSVKD